MEKTTVTSASPATTAPDAGQPPTANTTPAAEAKRISLTQLDSVKIYSPFKIYYDSPATSISAQNATGPFDILPGHKNFMTLLTPGKIIVRTPGGEEHIKIDSAILHVSGNIVKVFLDV
jgi:hypothetical protein